MSEPQRIGWYHVVTRPRYHPICASQRVMSIQRVCHSNDHQRFSEAFVITLICNSRNALKAPPLMFFIHISPSYKFICKQSVRTCVRNRSANTAYRGIITASPTNYPGNDTVMPLGPLFSPVLTCQRVKTAHNYFFPTSQTIIR